MAQQRRPMNNKSGTNMSEATTAVEIEDALVELLAPDGYYHYLGIDKVVANMPAAPRSAGTTDTAPESEPLHTAASSTIIDMDAIKKNYRKLSLKHHPDRPNGNADVFRILHRAHKVLLNDKLRQQYDILGIDLDDDDDLDDEDTSGGGDHPENDDDADSKTEKAQGSSGTKKPPKQETIVQEIASTVLGVVMQLVVKTVMMGCVACLVVRYRLLFYPAFLFICYIVGRTGLAVRADASTGTWAEVISPAVIAVGLVLMHTGRTRNDNLWTIWFWMGEAAVLAGFTFNSVSGIVPRHWITMSLLGVFAMLTALWFRGSIWNYAMVIGLESFFALIVAVAFPVFEFILESILNEKLKKVGDKVRAHHAILEKHYQAKLAQARQESKRPKK